MNAVISKTIKAKILGLGVQILEFPAQRKFVSSVCHAHCNYHTLPKTEAPTVLMLEYKFLTEMYSSHQYLSIDPKNSLRRPL